MRKTPSTILAAVNATAKGLRRAGVMDDVTRRAVEHLCQLPEKSPKAGAKRTAKR
jgi:putative transcriptional regulator